MFEITFRNVFDFPLIQKLVCPTFVWRICRPHANSSVPVVLFNQPIYLISSSKNSLCENVQLKVLVHYGYLLIQCFSVYIELLDVGKDRTALFFHTGRKHDSRVRSIRGPIDLALFHNKYNHVTKA